MSSFKKELLKDTIIDYIYDYAYTEKVLHLKSPSINLEIPVGSPIKDDDVFSSMVESVKNSTESSSYFSERENEYVKVSDEKGVLSSFLDRVERLGFSREKVNKKLIDQIIQFLIDKGYISRNQPIFYELKLTTKGIFHYENGLSFVKDYYNLNMVRQANYISLASFLAAILSVIIALI